MYQICVSGAAKGKSVEEGKLLAGQAGAAIAKLGHSLMTGATIGLPNYAAMGYKKAGGVMSVGISPAASKIEHVLKYRLPTDSYDTILYTGLHYVGRDSLLINSSDAVVSIGGRLGTLHEFTIAMETDTPIGFLEGTGGISTEIMDILHAAGAANSDNVVFSPDPEELVSKLTKLLDKELTKYKSLYKYGILSSMSDRFKWTIVIGLLAGIIVLGGIMIRSQYGRSTAIRSFHACEAAGYPVMETHPRRCSANGQTFTE